MGHFLSQCDTWISSFYALLLGASGSKQKLIDAVRLGGKSKTYNTYRFVELGFPVDGMTNGVDDMVNGADDVATVVDGMANSVNGMANDMDVVVIGMDNRYELT